MLISDTQNQTKAIARSELFSIRSECHDYVFEYARDHRNGDVLELRQPNREGIIKQRSGKIVIVVKDFQEAAAIKKECEEHIKRCNSKMHEIGAKEKLSVKDICYKINIVHAAGAVNISCKGAQRRKGITGAALKPDIEAYIKSLDISAIDEHLRAKKFLDSIKPQELYIRATDTGTSYRVTYYSPFESKRCQCSVGNVLIVVGDENTRLYASPERKQRKDISKAIFCYSVKLLPSSDLHTVYYIYPYNNHYESRRK